MRSWNSGNSQRLTGIFRLCLCLAVAGIIILGAADRTDAASATGGLPVINVFSADPITLKDGDSATYTFEVSGSTDMKVTEDGVIIKEIKSPPNTTLKGTVKGNTTYEIRTNNINTVRHHPGSNKCDWQADENADDIVCHCASAEICYPVSRSKRV